MKIHQLSVLCLAAALLTACVPDAVSSSGVSKATVQVPTGPDGLTTEQRNVGNRLKSDNAPEAIKYLYVVSVYTGRVMLQSVVRGKVTSSGKRLTPATIESLGDTAGTNLFAVNIGGVKHYTNEVLQDDGTYGSSQEYLYWWDDKGLYHQQYVSGGMFVHVSDKPMEF